MNDFLPIGSVVLLKGGVKKIMVVGYMAIDQRNQEKIYDYCGCIYPEGLLKSDQALLFDRNQIESICFEGYKNEEFELFVSQLVDVENHLHRDNSIDILE
jgi:hypothetical protein